MPRLYFYANPILGDWGSGLAGSSPPKLCLSGLEAREDLHGVESQVIDKSGENADEQHARGGNQ